jgi:hypothetical protein
MLIVGYVFAIRRVIRDIVLNAGTRERTLAAIA